ncbi:MAG: PilZ domain-containing protein [Myxococcota bacterium]
MNSEARSVLIVDDPEGGLGEVALRLIRLGIDSFYAPEAGEAWLLAQQEAYRIRLLLLAPGVNLREVESVRNELAERAPEVPRSLMVVGPLPDDERREELRKAGVCWALWEPWDESALRMALSGAMAAVPESSTSRRHLRFPTMLLGRAFRGIQRQDVLVSDLSEGGAFLETPHPFDTGTRITLEIEGVGGSIVTKADVAYRNDPGESGEGHQMPGMGVEFGELPEAAKACLERTLVEHQRRFEV